MLPFRNSLYARCRQLLKIHHQTSYVLEKMNFGLLFYFYLWLFSFEFSIVGIPSYAH